MGLRITRIEVAGPQRRARRLVFEDGAGGYRTISAAALKAIGVSEGELVDTEVFETSLAAVENSLAKDRALRLLGYRDRSAAEVTHKLADDGYPEPVAREVVERLVQSGLLDDERFATHWVEGRVANGIGPRRIEHELVEKGIASDLTERLLEPIRGSAQAAQVARQLDRLDTAERTKRDRAIRRLIAKGFDLDIVLRVVREAGRPPLD